MDKMPGAYTITFELEANIKKCEEILVDLRDVQDPYVQALRTVYQVHFEKMWNTFDNLSYEMNRYPMQQKDSRENKK